MNVEILGKCDERIWPPDAEGRTVPHYHPLSKLDENPWTVARWIGVWLPGGPMLRGFQVKGGRLWQVCTGEQCRQLQRQVNQLVVRPELDRIETTRSR